MKAMKLFKSLKACAWLPAALLLAGCGGAQYASDPVNPPQPFAFPGQSAPAYAGQPPAPSVAPSPAPSLPMPPTIEEPFSGPRLPLAARSEPPNLVSLHGAAPLGPWKRAGAVSLGFPLLSARILMGVTPKLDVGVEYDTLYGLMHDVRASARWSLVTGDNLSFGLVGDAGPAFYTRRPGFDFHGARWLTGRRDYNASAGVVLSVQGSSPRASRFFVAGRCLLAMDMDPLQTEPLGGTPPPVLFSANLLSEVGLEAPVSVSRR
jgi:hypothetical protein